MLKALSCLNICMIISACSSIPDGSDSATKVAELSHAIQVLSEEVSIEEANEASQLLLNTTLELSKQYDMVSPALYHNMLVNTGIRKRGLCCHWAEDLHAKLRTLQNSSLKFDWLVARLGSQLREHNTIVIYASSSSWEHGVVFDPWRKAGLPYWTKVKSDKYPWQPHPLSGRWDVLRCK